ncbi:type IV pilus modification protein PilV [Dyella humi]|uniref:Type IV pilus modification protein PilV n=1 Tax=Dyella humi TaxID=1770547 RepID=A0ABW8IIS1_9GAMM
MPVNHQSSVRNGGYSLLEVLVALVIISIGLIGIAALQASALAGTHTSQTESIAAIEARSLADSMLANPAFWDGGAAPTSSVTITPSGSGYSITGSSALAATTNCAGGSNCSASDMAAYDISKWTPEYFQQIPTAVDAVINCNTNVPPVCTIQLDWKEKATTAINKGTQSNPASSTTVSYTLVNQF